MPLFLVLPLLFEDLTRGQTVAITVAMIALPPVLLALVWRDMKRWLDASRQAPRVRALAPVPAPESEKALEKALDHAAARAPVRDSSPS